jgi:acyl-CoA synthetase (AMP-forming)/AMP-acid ligase II
MTHSQLWYRVDRLSNALIMAGLRKGDRLLAWLPNAYQAIETELACLQVGGVWVTLNAALTWPEVSAVIVSTEPRLFVLSASLEPKIPAANPEVRRMLDQTTTFVVGGDPLGDGRFDYESTLRAGSAQRPQVSVGPDDLLRLRYTSGTTGKAKAAMIAHAAYLASLETMLSELPPLSPADRVLHAAPLTHASAAYMYPMLWCGGANVIVPKFEAGPALEIIERERISILFAVPTMLHRFGESAALKSRNLSSLRSVSYGAAPTPPEVLRPMLERLPGKLLHIYGLTEALHPVTTLKREEHVPGNPKLGSIGKPTILCELRVVKDDGGDAEAGEVGELWVRGPITMRGYWRDPEGSAEVMRGEWITTGDVGYRDAEGYYWIVDRKKDVIISGGFNVYSSEVEAVLMEHASVLEAAVIGVPHPDWGEEVHAVVTLRPGASADEAVLIAHCRARLAGYKTPKGVTIWEGGLPRNSTGKVLKSDLSARVRGGVSSTS